MGLAAAMVGGAAAEPMLTLPDATPKEMALLDVVRAALKQNPGYLQNRLSFESQKASLKGTRAGFYGIFPTLGLSYTEPKGAGSTEQATLSAGQNLGFGGKWSLSSNLGRSAAGGIVPLTYSSAASLGFSYPLGKTQGGTYQRIGITTAEINYRSYLVSYWKSVQGTIQSAVSTYLSAWSAKQSYRISKDTEAQSQFASEANELKHSLGMQSDLDFARSEISYESSKISTLQAGLSCRNALQNLAQFLGLPRETPIDVTDEIALELPTPPDEAEAVEKARTNGPALKQLGYSEQLQQLTLFQARRAIVPDGSFGVSYGFSGNGTDVSTGTRFNNYQLSATVALNLPLNQALNRLAYEQAKRGFESFEIGAQDQRRSIDRDVSQQVRSIRTAFDSLTIARRNMDLAQKNFDLMSDCYTKEGICSFLDFQQAQQQLSQTRRDYINSKTQLLNSYLSLKVSLGEDLLPFLEKVLTALPLEPGVERPPLCPP